MLNFTSGCFVNKMAEIVPFFCVFPADLIQSRENRAVLFSGGKRYWFYLCLFHPSGCGRVFQSKPPADFWLSKHCAACFLRPQCYPWIIPPSAAGNRWWLAGAVGRKRHQFRIRWHFQRFHSYIQDLSSSLGISCWRPTVWRLAFYF